MRESKGQPSKAFVLAFAAPHIGDSFVSVKKKSQRHVAHHFEALNLSFQMAYSSKSGDMRFLRKLGFVFLW